MKTIFRGPDYPVVIFRGNNAYEHIEPGNMEWYKQTYPDREIIVQNGRHYGATKNIWKKEELAYPPLPTADDVRGCDEG